MFGVFLQSLSSQENYNYYELNPLHDLSAMNDLVMPKSDKGNSVVVINKIYKLGLGL